MDAGEPKPEFLETTVDKFIFRVATDRLYSPDGVWAQAKAARAARPERLPPAARRRRGLRSRQTRRDRLAVGDEFAELETIKANPSLFSPVGGTLAEVNPVLDLTPETINQDPYGKGWLAVLEAADWETDRRSCSIPRRICRRFGPGGAGVSG